MDYGFDVTFVYLLSKHTDFDNAILNLYIVENVIMV